MDMLSTHPLRCLCLNGTQSYEQDNTISGVNNIYEYIIRTFLLKSIMKYI